MRVNLYATYRDITGVKRLDLPGRTVAAVLAELIREQPAMAKELFSAEGRLSERVSIFRNGRDVRYLQGLETKLAEDDVLDLFPPVAGG